MLRVQYVPAGRQEFPLPPLLVEPPLLIDPPVLVLPPVVIEPPVLSEPPVLVLPPVLLPPVLLPPVLLPPVLVTPPPASPVASPPSPPFPLDVPPFAGESPFDSSSPPPHAIQTNVVSTRIPQIRSFGILRRYMRRKTTTAVIHFIRVGRWGPPPTDAAWSVSVSSFAVFGSRVL
jgi:hypothetical protein